jgi:serine/threonine protein kinase
MSRLDHDRVMTILADALDLPASRRSAFLDSTCGGEPELRREVDELLEGEPRAAACFDVASEQLARADPQRIGPYTIVETLGEGGMAIVYKAEQRHPVKRTVAIKLIKLGMDTRQFVARFEAERQALAMMDHPNVARVFDAGAIESGRPYFVMEYVPGRHRRRITSRHRNVSPHPATPIFSHGAAPR